MLDDKEKIAVALLYDKINAPQVVAKGRGELAQSILEIARESDVAISENEFLAETLARLQLNEEIPRGLFRSVAIVLAWVYRLQGKTPWDEEGDAL